MALYKIALGLVMLIVGYFFLRYPRAHVITDISKDTKQLTENVKKLQKKSTKTKTWLIRIFGLIVLIGGIRTVVSFILDEI